MAEDWRVRITVDGDPQGVLQALHERESQDATLSRIAVSSDGPNLFLYADTQAAAAAAEKALADVLAEQGRSGEPKLERWDHADEEWQDPDVHLTTCRGARAARGGGDRRVTRGEHRRMGGASRAAVAPRRGVVRREAPGGGVYGHAPLEVPARQRQRRGRRRGVRQADRERGTRRGERCMSSPAPGSRGSSRRPTGSPSSAAVSAA